MSGTDRLEILAIVPARGGSKGLPRKNLVEFLGRPLLEWSIDAARSSRLVTRTMVTTDDEEIAACGQAAGAEVPFLRPAELAGDAVTDLPVFEHVLDWYARHESYTPDLVVHLRPTSPVRPAGIVDEGIERLVADPRADSLRVVCEPSNNPYKMWRLGQTYLIPLVDSGIPEQYNRPRQELPSALWQIGTLDVIRTGTITVSHSMSGSRILPMIVDPSIAVDIDDARSLRHAEDVALELGLTAR